MDIHWVELTSLCEIRSLSLIFQFTQSTILGMKH